MASNPRNPLIPLPADATRVGGLLGRPGPTGPQAGLLGRPTATMQAAPESEWWRGIMQRAVTWARENDVPDPREFPPLKLLQAVMGDDPMSGVGGPSGAISSFATPGRSRALMQRFADPGFHNFIIKHGPARGSFTALRDHAPTAAVDDLWQRYMATPEAQAAIRRDAARRARRTGMEQSRRSGDVLR